MSPAETIRDLFAKHGIDKLPRDRVHAAIRERFPQADLDLYKEALTALHDSGALDKPGVVL